MTALTLPIQDTQSFFANHRSVRRYKPYKIPQEHLDLLMFAAQRAPTDATAQMYSFIRLVDPELRQWVAELSDNPHMATASEAFIVCADVFRLKELLQSQGYAFGHFPLTALHFAIGDAVLAGQNMMLAAELLGYRGCWVGGILTGIDLLADRLQLPKGVWPFSGLTLGMSDEPPSTRPRLKPELIFHENTYNIPSPMELEEANLDMNPITRGGNWIASLARYFASEGSMEQRETRLVHFLKRQGFDVDFGRETDKRTRRP
ncbi:MAG: nitroreductase family protein [Deinococcaceae bacterium]